MYGEPPVDPGPGLRVGHHSRHGRITDGRAGEVLTESEVSFPFLHDEIVRIIEINSSEPMTSVDLTDTTNAEGR